MAQVQDHPVVFDALVARLTEHRSVDAAVLDRLALVGADDPLPRMSELGRLAFEVELDHALTVTEAAARVPVAPVDAVVVGGLPRTGTTLLLRLLGQLTTRRPVATWEAHSPHLCRTGATEEARREATDRFALVREIAPKVHAMHALDPEAPEECTPLLAHALTSVQWGIMGHCPSYVDEVLGSSLADGYRLWAQQLTLVDPTARWLLKCPFHVNDYAALAARAPGVRLVHIRRDAVATTRSFLNMAGAGRQIFEPWVRLEEMGPFWLERLRRLLVRGEAGMAHLPHPPVTVDHADLVADPIGTAVEVAHRLGEEVVARPAEPPIGPAAYDRLPLAAFGLSAAAVERALGPHIGGPLLAVSPPAPGGRGRRGAGGG